jgi:integrase
MTGIDVRHRKTCEQRRDDGKCCGASFQAHVFDKRSGKRIRKTFETKTAARLWRQDAIAALHRGEFAAVTPSSRTVVQALEDMIDGMKAGRVLDRSGRRYRPATVRSYEQAANRVLGPALGHLRLSEVRRGDVQRVVDRLHEKGMSGSTVRNKLDPLRVVFRRAMQDEEVMHNPTEALRLPANRPTPRHVANPERVGELLDALPVGERAAWSCAFFAGLRVGELRALRWHAVDFDAGVIRVLAGWDDQEGEQETKTAAGERTIPLAGRLRTELVRHKLATGRDGDDLCFGRTAGDAFVRSTLRSRALRAWGAAGLDSLTPHEGRHCCASYLAAAGLTPKEAQTAMGHADIRTTLNVYAKAVPGWESKAVGLLDAFLGDGATVARQSAPDPERSTAVPLRSRVAL